MYEAFLNMPLLAAGPLIIGSLCLYGGIGVLLVRRRLLPKWNIRVDDSGFSGSLVNATMVFYGLAVALIAVSVWQTYSDVSKIVSAEATSLAALYRDVSGYPDPHRSKLQGGIRDYVKDIIDQSWPMMRRGKIPTAGVAYMNQFQAVLIGFEPSTDGQKILHAETLRAYNQMIIARRMRLDSVETGLPAVMWVVIIAGSFIGLSSAFFFKVEDVRLHIVQVLLLAAFIGLVIFMIFALDHPFRGDLAISSDSYQLIYDQLMNLKP